MNLELVEKNTAWKQFMRDVKTGLGHAYIFIGEDEEMLSSLLHFASLACFCPDLCLTCDTCLRVADGSHPDIFYGDGAVMKVREDIEPMLERVAIRPVQADKKIFVISHADKLNAVCQNKILKTFEEPPPYVTIILGASGESGLLSTIRSRGKKLYLDVLTSGDIAKELTEDGSDGETALLAATYSMGNLAKARSFAQSGDYREQYEGVFEMLMRLKKSSQIAGFLAKDYLSKENIALTFDFMEIILCDAMKTLLHCDGLKCTVNREKDLLTVASGFSVQGLSMALNVIANGKEQLNYNVNFANVANGVLFGILEARYIWKKNQ